MNKSQLTTACMINSGFSDKSKVCTFNKNQYQIESEMLFCPLLLIHAKRYRQPLANNHKTIIGQKNNLAPLAINSKHFFKSICSFENFH